MQETQELQEDLGEPAEPQEDVVEALSALLVADGFTRYCFGPKDDPHALIAVYEWAQHLDVITMHPDGRAAAARLVIPPGGIRVPDKPDPFVLNPPDTAIWAFEGPMPTTMFALLKLPHPEDPAAPVAEVATPEALRVPQEHQCQIRIRVPETGRAGVRAARLSEPKPPRMSEQFFNDLLDEIDSERALGFALYFIDNGIFRWGNFAPVVGRPAIATFTQAFFGMVSSVRHDVKNYWQVDDRRAVTNGWVTFTPHEGEPMTVPFMTLSYFTPDGTLMESYQVCLDPSPLVGVTVPTE